MERWGSDVTFGKMSNVYLTLVSDVTSDYGSNVANKFKVKPQLRLPGEGWKVSIVSAILPRMALFKDLQSETKNLIEMWYDVDGVSGSSKQRQAWVNGDDLKALEKDYKCRTGVEFMNEVKSLLDERRDGQNYSAPATDNRILEKFAKTMQWIQQKNNKDYYEGSNLVISYPSHTRDTSELSNGEPTRNDGTWFF